MITNFTNWPIGIYTHPKRGRWIDSSGILREYNKKQHIVCLFIHKIYLPLSCT